LFGISANYHRIPIGLSYYRIRLMRSLDVRLTYWRWMILMLMWHLIFVNELLIIEDQILMQHFMTEMNVHLLLVLTIDSMYQYYQITD